MSPAVMAVVAAVAAADGGTAIALDDGTVWVVYDGEWEELGGCDDGDVVELIAVGGELEIDCGDGSGWTWSPEAGWMPRAPAAVPALPGHARSWWPSLELSLRTWRSEPGVEAWVRLRWDL